VINIIQRQGMFVCSHPLWSDAVVYTCALGDRDVCSRRIGDAYEEHLIFRKASR